MCGFGGYWRLTERNECSTFSGSAPGLHKLRNHVWEHSSDVHVQRKAVLAGIASFDACMREMATVPDRIMPEDGKQGFRRKPHPLLNHIRNTALVPWGETEKEMGEKVRSERHEICPPGKVVRWLCGWCEQEPWEEKAWTVFRENGGDVAQKGPRRGSEKLAGKECPAGTDPREGEIRIWKPAA